jgi:hypothetical protein
MKGVTKMEETKKLEYQSPELTEYGSVDELTQLQQGRVTDADGFSGLER